MNWKKSLLMVLKVDCSRRQDNLFDELRGGELGHPCKPLPPSTRRL
jgi:hypothetical protein